MANATRTLSANKVGYITYQNSSKHYTVSSSEWYQISGRQSYLDGAQNALLFEFASFPDSLAHYKLVSARFRFQIKTKKRKRIARVWWSASSFNANTVKYDTRPAFNYLSDCELLIEEIDETGSNYWIPDNTANEVKKIVNAKSFELFVVGESSSDTSASAKSILTGGSDPQLEITYDNAVKATSKVDYKSGPKSGYSDPAKATTFQWQYVKGDSIVCASDTWAQDHATFYWKKSTDANYTSVSISGTTTKVTIPANTFPGGSTIQWYVSGTDEDGTTTRTPASGVYSFSTASGSVATQCVDPLNEVIDGGKAYRFRWTITSTDGKKASRTRLNYKLSTDGTWTSLLDTNSHVTSYTVPADTFAGGEYDWRPLAYNVDGVLGSYDTGHFISIAPPNPLSGLEATEVPYSTISWQSDDQQAYQISVDGVVVKKAFGSDVYSYQLEEPLDDGTHVISVIVQGEYGFWSSPAEVTVTISNTPGDTVTLDGSFELDALLVWSTESVTTNFQIYRDGVRIGHTTKTNFEDRFVLGDHSYYVLNRLDDGNYTKSNEVTGTMTAYGVQISRLDESGWLDISLSENSVAMQSFKAERKSASYHVAGAIYPIIELSSFEDLAGSYDCAFRNMEDAKAFEAMLGHEVIIKSRGDHVLFGVITSLSSRVKTFTTGYTFSLSRIHLEDFVDETDS